MLRIGAAVLPWGAAATVVLSENEGIPKRADAHPADPLEARAIASARRGDPAPFDYLVTKYARRVASAAWTITGSGDLAEELAQEAFVRAFRSIRKFREGEPFGPWIVRIVTNLAMDEIRRRRRLAPETASPDRAASRTEAPDVRAGSSELARRIDRALASLPERQQVVARLALVEEWDHAEIAAATGLDVGTVRSHLSRARARLREMLGDLWRKG
ncbi:MAG: RNA polymerase sigma factor [Thermoanaerobaculia bacterium]